MVVPFGEVRVRYIDGKFSINTIIKVGGTYQLFISSIRIFHIKLGSKLYLHPQLILHTHDGKM